MTVVNKSYGTSGVGRYCEQDVPNHLHNSASWNAATRRQKSTWTELKALHPDRQFLRSWHDVPLGWVTARRAAKFDVLIDTVPVGYLLTGYNALIFPLYEVIDVPF